MLLFRLCLVVIILSVLLDYAVNLSDTRWSWDINHMMYFGQRLLENDLHWTIEFDDKLPVNQFLFVIPAAFDSVLAWQILSIFAMLGGAIATAFVTRQVLVSGLDLPDRVTTMCAQTSAVASLAGFAFLPGGIYHINPLASASAIGAMALLMAAVAPIRFGKTPSIWLFAFSALLASLAIGIRPYFLLCLCCAAFWLTLRLIPTGVTLLKAFCVATIWIAAVGLAGALTNVMPYVLTGNLQAFLDGMQLLRQDLILQPLTSNLKEQHSWFTDRILPVFPFLALASVSTAIAAVIHLLQGRKTRLSDQTRGLWTDILVITLILPGLIEAAILYKHFWSHYLQLFVPFFAIGTGFFAALLWRGPLQARTGSEVLKLALVFLIMLPLWRISLEHVRWFSSRDDTAEEIDLLSNQIAQVQETLPSGSRDFLAPNLMYEHWRLREPRHGFPHAANTDFIVGKNWWVDLEIPAGYDLPKNYDEYCNQIDRQGPSIIVLKIQDQLADCLRQSAVYSALEPANVTSDDVLFFLRRNGS